MGKYFIHAVCAGQQVAANVWDVCQFKQTLNGAVLAVFTVENREAYIDWANFHRVSIHQQQTVMAVVRGDNSSSCSLIFPFHRSDVGDVTGVFQPATVFGDADHDHIIFLFVQIIEHRGCRNNRHIMLAGNAAEQYGNFHFIHQAHTPSKLVLRNHQSLFRRSVRYSGQMHT